MNLRIVALAVTLSVMSAQPFAIASDYGSVDAGTATKIAAGAKDDKATAGLRMDNIQDVAYSLQRLRQQTINVFVEATRKPVHRYDLNVRSLSSMPTDPLENDSAYLPLRKAWLVFFIGTMEPLVQILNEHLKSLDERTAQSGLPQQFRSEWHGIVSEWTNALHTFNKQLDVCAAVVDDPAAENVQVAKAARTMDSQISSLQTILQKASKFLQEKIPQS